ncbi:uncharacterized protein MELLADRAFT_94676 [Melampsora larici-populina 98AG31]|uniref:Uncharacterized protein n=1 Tax=Melampsora larici-populina (strain 98AG31 / pathotype 3-4-7) TaxID=747676 RepID=F4S7J7_MELLP|nr:uncharacterized protein MELLADRAFT_94676 [Melampsora larici-populina 98AG31]EGF99331.1 hypothetical protein MELLADRAFT_94676 [Melampsora larici-populina 98AG31]
MTKAKKGKAKTLSQPNSAKTDAGADASTSHASTDSKMPQGAPPAGPNPSGFHPMNPEPQKMSPETTNEDWLKVQTLNDDLKIFLTPGNEKNTPGITSLKLYRILVHFNPKTKHRPNTLKEILWNAFISDVFPLLKPHMLPSPPAPMESEFLYNDFNPLSKKTTRKQLTDTIHSVVPKFGIPGSSTRDRILIVYKAFVDKDLKLPWLTEFIKPPNVVSKARVGDLSMEELRMTLQERAPHVFIHSGPMSLGVLINLYIKFVIEDPVAEDLLVRGFHYSLLRKEA